MQLGTRLLVFHPALAPYRIDFLNELNESFESKFYFFGQRQISQNFSLRKLESKCNFEINLLNRGFNFYGFRIRFGVWPIINKERPKTILCSEFSPVTFSVFILYFLSRKRFRLYTICDDSIDNAIKRKGLRLLARNIISKNIDGVIFPSQEVCNWYNANISDKTKTLVLPIIHKEEVFRKRLFESLQTANEYIKIYQLSGRKVILFVGRLAEVKNVSHLIKVCSNLSCDNWVLVVVGDGYLLKNLKQQALDLDITEKIHFVGSKEENDLLSWFALGQLFVLPSTHEPFGAVVNEALLAGCEVLCSELAGASTLITKENGKLFDPYNEQELLEHINDSLDKIQPITKEKIAVRESKMPFTFDEKVNELFEKL